MKPRVRSLTPLMSLVVIAAGWSSGCSRSGSTNVDPKKAREALSKRNADYDDNRGRHAKAKGGAPVQPR